MRPGRIFCEIMGIVRHCHAHDDLALENVRQTKAGLLKLRTRMILPGLISCLHPQIKMLAPYKKVRDL